MQSVYCGFRRKGLLVKLWLHSHEAQAAELKCCTEIARSKKVPSGFEAPRGWAGKKHPFNFNSVGTEQVNRGSTEDPEPLLSSSDSLD